MKRNICRGIVLFFLLGNLQITFSQYPSLKVGDKTPNYILKNLINYPSTSAKLSDFKGKVVILDFWATSCAGCVESWPKLQHFQDRFSKELQIILINTHQGEEIVRKAIDRRRDAGVVDLKIPSVCGDTIITQLFPYFGIPHIVWIDQKGIVQSITDGQSLNEENIMAMLKDKPNIMPQKITAKVTVDNTKPLSAQMDNTQVLQYSFLSRYNGQIGSTHGFSSDTTHSVIRAINRSITEMYRYAFSPFFTSKEKTNPYLIPISRVVIESKSSEINDSTMQTKHLYIYEGVTTGYRSTKQLQQIMQADLVKYFGLRVCWKKRMKDCLVLKAQDTALISYSTGTPTCFVNDTEAIINDVTIKDFIVELETGTRYYYSRYPIVDETGFSGKVGNIKLYGNMYDPIMLNIALQKYKMSLTIEQRLVDVLVINDSISVSK